MSDYEDDEFDLTKKYKIADILTLDLKELIVDEDFDTIGRKAVEDFEADKTSRGPWEKKMEASRKLAQQVWDKKNWPWNNASNVKFPLVSIASIQFAARAYPSLVTGNEVVTHRVIGEDPFGLKAARAKRVSSHMNWQVLVQDESWETEMDKGLHMLPIWGNFFKKVYYDANKGYVRSMAVSPYNLVLPYYGAWDSCRKTLIHQMGERQIVENQRMGLYREVDLSSPPTSAEFEEQTEAKHNKGLETGENPDNFRIVLEQHSYFDLDGDGYEEPYIVVVDHDTKVVLDMSPRFGVRDITCSKSYQVDAMFEQFMRDLQEREANGDLASATQDYEVLEGMAIQVLADSEIYKIDEINHFVKFAFIPSFDESIYDTGFGILLGPTNEAVNSLINQMVDSGTLNNSSSGFIGAGAKVRGGSLSFEPFEWKKVDSYGNDLKSNIVPLPVNQPSAVLFNLLQLLISYGERLSSVSDLMQGVTPGQNTPATTSMAALEQGQKVFSSIFKRIYRGLKQEMLIVHRLNRDTLDPKQYFATIDTGDTQEVFAVDYLSDPTDITPSADPTAASTELRRARAEFLAARAGQIPGYAQYEVEKRLLEEYDITGIEVIYPDPEGPNAVPPPGPSLEMQIKAQEAEAKVMKAKIDGQIAMSKLDAEIAKLGAEIAALKADAFKSMASGAKDLAEAKIEGQQLALEKLKEYRESVRMILEHSEKEEDREVEKEKIKNDSKKAGSAQNGKAD